MSKQQRLSSEQHYRLVAWGWDDQWEAAFQESAAGDTPARVRAVLGPLSRLITAEGERDGRLAGRLRRYARQPELLPTTGDWVIGRVVGSEVIIEHILPRRTACRRTAPDGRIQVVAANVDRLFVVMGLDNDFSPRRIERYLVLAYESGARPVVVLNKSDLCDDIDARLAELAPVVAGVDVHVVSALSGEGVQELEAYLEPALTLALLGSSGAGKSTLVNRFMGQDIAKTAAVRESDQTGRHTTTHREIFRLPSGALLLDTPGLREVQLSGGGGSLVAFGDIQERAVDCRFNDCTHGDEPGCAVRQAVETGDLPESRLESYHMLRREEQRQRDLAQLGAARLERKRWKNLLKKSGASPIKPSADDNGEADS